MSVRKVNVIDYSKVLASSRKRVKVRLTLKFDK